MKEGDVILAVMPQADGRIKERPTVVLCIMQPFGDHFTCGVSTQLHHEVRGFDEIVGPGDADYAGSGLKARSLIRLGYAGIVHPRDIVCRIGSISGPRLKRLLGRFGDHLKEKAKSLPS